MSLVLSTVERQEKGKGNRVIGAYLDNLLLGPIFVQVNEISRTLMLSDWCAL